ncbi:MAG: hypothetical protein J6Q22_00090 [Prevotella sp.]|nr:hypothetical protein [Prevotella sp.]
MGKIAKYWDNSGIALEGYPATNVKRLYSFFVGQLYDAVSRVILLDNIPEDNDYDFIIENLIMCGHIAAVNTKEGFRLLNGALGGKRNEYYRPTEIIIDNPVLGDIRCVNDKEGKMIYLTPHDRLHTPPMGFGGLSDLIGSTAQLLADNTSSINVAQINGRVLAVYSAGNQQEAIAAELVLKEMYGGQPYKVIHGQNLLSKFDVNPIASTVTGTMLKELVELRQYIHAQFWNAIGIDANFNMKRERLVSAEVEANATSIKVPISTILSELNAGFDVCNEIFGTDIHARLNPEFKPLDRFGSETGMNGGSSNDVSGSKGSEEQHLRDDDNSDESYTNTSGMGSSSNSETDTSDKNSETGDSNTDSQENDSESGSSGFETGDVNIQININTDGGDTDAEVHDNNADSEEEED